MSNCGVLGCESDRCTELLKDPEVAELNIVQHADPHVALASALKRGDERFLGVAQVGIQFPGVEDIDQTVMKQHGVREIYGPGDTASSSETELVLGAMEYARAYNQLLREWIREHPRKHSSADTGGDIHSRKGERP